MEDMYSYLLLVDESLLEQDALDALLHRVLLGPRHGVALGEGQLGGGEQLLLPLPSRPLHQRTGLRLLRFILLHCTYEKNEKRNRTLQI